MKKKQVTIQLNSRVLSLFHQSIKYAIPTVPEEAEELLPRGDEWLEDMFSQQHWGLFAPSKVNPTMKFFSPAVLTGCEESPPAWDLMRKCLS